jgi:hypothetical protein
MASTISGPSWTRTVGARKGGTGRDDLGTLPGDGRSFGQGVSQLSIVIYQVLLTQH